MVISTPETTGVSFNVRLAPRRGGRIAVIDLTAFEDRDIDALFASLRHLLKTWPAHQPFLVLFDIGHTRARFSPQIRRRIQALNASLPADLNGRAAVVVPRNPMAHLLMLLMQDAGVQDGEMVVETRVFFDIGAGYNWLLEAIS